MEISDFYMSLPYDLSGARSKNRFRVELLWGISKMLDIYDEDDFTIVFDYVCDIEIHYKDKFEFYQLKSHMGIKKYTIDNLTNPGKKKNSILGKLFILKKDNELNVKLAIVSNGYLQDNGVIKEEFKEIELNDLSEKSKMKIKDSIQTELKLDEVNLSTVFFIHTDMNLKDPESEIKGKLITKFEKIKGCEPKKPNALYRFVYDTVRQKACYEFSCEDYDKLLSLKGMSKVDFEKMLNLFMDNIDKSVELTKNFIDSLKKYKKRVEAKNALASLLEQLTINKELQSIEKKIAYYIYRNGDKLPDLEEDLIFYLMSYFDDEFTIEYSSIFRYVFIILILKRYEEGVYKNEISI